MGDLYKKWRKYFTGSGEVYIFLRSAVWIAIMPFMLRCYRLEELFRKITPRGVRRKVDPEKVTVLVSWWFNRNVLMFKPRCLNRSLVLYKFLRECGSPIRIHYGVKQKPDGGFDGHSWLSLKGAPIAPDGHIAHEFRETFSYPPEERTGD